jgi:nucleoside phosphorylase
MLDEEHPLLLAADPADTNVYLLGRIGAHNVVIACLPAETTGTVSAAIVAKDMLRSFPKIRFGLMVGVAGGVPAFGLDGGTDDDDERLGDGKDIRLGDVVVSLHSKDSDAVVQYDFGKSIHGGQFVRTGCLRKPPNLLLQAVSMLQGQHVRKGNNNLSYHLSKMLEKNQGLAEKFQYQGSASDRLFAANIIHAEGQKSCEPCCGDGGANLVPRKNRKDTFPVIHYGTIGSADQVMKDPSLRDIWARKERIICFEMEAAGIS